MWEKALVVLGIIAMVLGVAAFSWGITAFVYWLITLCFGIEWSVLHSTGVWLTLILVSSSINGIKANVKY